MNHHLFAVGRNVQGGKRSARASQLGFQRRDGPSNSAGGDSVGGETLDGFQRNQIRKTEESLAPARQWKNQAQASPIVQFTTANANHALDFAARVAIIQS